MLNTIEANKTEQRVLKVVQNLDLKGYEWFKTKNTNGDYNHLLNFFIWKKINKSDYIRIALMREGWNEKTLFFWDLETSFKPFAFKHNHRKDAHIISEKFKPFETDKYFNYFLNITDKIKVRR